MWRLALFLDEEEIFYHCGLVKMDGYEMCQKETSNDDSTTDASNVDQQVCKVIYILLYEYGILTQLDLNFKCTSLYKFFRINGIVGLL